MKHRKDFLAFSISLVVHKLDCDVELDLYLNYRLPPHTLRDQIMVVAKYEIILLQIILPWCPLLLLESVKY